MAGNAPTFNRVRLYSHKWTNYPTDAKQTPCGAFLYIRKYKKNTPAGKLGRYLQKQTFSKVFINIIKRININCNKIHLKK